jgi:hypothetical protein
VNEPSSLASRVLAGQAPQALRLAAARGALPLPPEEILHLQVALRRDRDEQVRALAEASLRQLPSQTIEILRQAPRPDPEVLSYLLEERTDLDPAVRRELVALPGIDPALTARLASSESEPAVLEALVANQQLLRANPELVSTLRGNPSLPADLLRRLEDLADHLPPTAPAEVATEPAAAVAEPSPEEVPLAKDPRLAALGIDSEVEAMLPVLDLDVGDLLSRSEILGGEELAKDVETADVYRRIQELNAAQRLRLAIFGTREERMILVRDSNRLIATAAIRNPRLTEQEVEIISLSRNVIEDVLIEITRRREAMKRYAVVHNLVKNPKVPAAISVRLMSRLHDRDLKLLTTNRNIPEAVRINARKQAMARAARQKISSFRKGR